MDSHIIKLVFLTLDIKLQGQLISVLASADVNFKHC